MSIIITLIIIAVLILVHEWGHFTAARRIGIPVHEFSLGFGYRLFSINRNGVMYSIRLIPLGGFVRMAGEELGDYEDPKGLSNRTPLEKMRVSFAGPFMNFVLAILIFAYTYTFIGIPQASDQPVIGSIVAGKPAELAGLRPNDEILMVNGQRVGSWTEFTSIIAASQPGEVLELSIKRSESNLSINVIPELNEATEIPAIGVMNQVVYQKQGIIESIKTGVVQTYELTIMLLGGLWILITGGASAGDLAGPVGIAQLVGEAAQGGTVFLLAFTAFLSINLGIINLLPIPALDGSRIVFALVEAIRRKPLEPEREGFIHWVGFLFLITLIIFVTYNDIIRIIKG